MKYWAGEAFEQAQGLLESADTRRGRPRGTYLMGMDESGDWVSQIHRSYGAQLKRFLTRRLGNAAAAEDVAQEAFLQLHRLEQAKVRHPRALLFVTASNLATRYLQRAEPEGAGSPGDAESVADTALIPETVAEIDQAMKVLQDIVEAMPDRLRVVWILRHIEDLSAVQIAERLGLSLKAVTRRLERGTVYCRAALLKQGIDRVGTR